MQRLAVVLCLLVVLPLLAEAGNINKGKHHKEENDKKDKHHKSKDSDKEPEKKDDKESVKTINIKIEETNLESKDDKDNDGKEKDDGLIHLDKNDEKELDEMLEKQEKETKLEMTDGEKVNFKLKHARRHQDNEFAKFQKMEYERFEKRKFFQFQMERYRQKLMQFEHQLQMQRKQFERDHGWKMRHEQSKHHNWLKDILQKNIHFLRPHKFDPDADVQESEIKAQKDAEQEMKDNMAAEEADSENKEL